MFLEFGESVFEETSAFNEMEVLRENTSYLISTLDLEGLDFEYSDKAEERIQEECCPGGPYIVFRNEPSVPLLIINQQANRPYFELEVPIYKGDCVKRVAERISKEVRSIKGISFKRLLFRSFIITDILFSNRFIKSKAIEIHRYNRKFSTSRTCQTEKFRPKAMQRFASLLILKISRSKRTEQNRVLNNNSYILSMKIK